MVGKQHALALNAVLFGTAHVVTGTPSGLVGFLLTAFVGWLWGKSMLWTGGSFWAV